MFVLHIHYFVGEMGLGQSIQYTSPPPSRLMQFPGEDAIPTAAEDANLGPDEAEEVKG